MFVVAVDGVCDVAVVVVGVDAVVGGVLLLLLMLLLVLQM